MDDMIGLARRARAGGREDLEALLRGSARLVHALARARHGDSLTADAVAADALARIAFGVGRLKDAQAYPHWLYRVTARCAADAKRPPARGIPADPVDPARGPVETLVQTERAQRVRTAIAALPRRLREPVYLHFVEGLGYRAVADVLGVGVGTVARRMRSALDRLRATLGDDHDDA